MGGLLGSICIACLVSLGLLVVPAPVVAAAAPNSFDDERIINTKARSHCDAGRQQGILGQLLPETSCVWSACSHAGIKKCVFSSSRTLMCLVPAPKTSV